MLEEEEHLLVRDAQGGQALIAPQHGTTEKAGIEIRRSVEVVNIEDRFSNADGFDHGGVRMGIAVASLDTRAR
jgi:hypothetical protein